MYTIYSMYGELPVGTVAIPNMPVNYWNLDIEATAILGIVHACTCSILGIAHACTCM